MNSIKIKSPNGSPFKAALMKELENFFRDRKMTGNFMLFVKAAIIILLGLSLFILPYVFLDFFKKCVILYLITRFIAGWVAASAGFCIGHDALHGSFCESKTINNIMGLTFEVYGASSFRWKTKHNIIHHSKTNTPEDGDIFTAGYFRFAPFQEWLPRHRYQHLYARPAYFMEHMLWYINDLSIYKELKEDMSTSDKMIFFLGKIFYILKVLILPILFFGWWGLVGFMLMECVCGYRLSTVFQIAHVQTKSEFFEPDQGGKIEIEWAEEQVRSTANFATKNRWVTFWQGGLNFQIEHHLFPFVSHVHYPAMQSFVMKLCEEYNLPYHQFKTMREGVKDHFLHLKNLGQGH